MNLKPAKRKKYSAPHNFLLLPVVEDEPIKGYFNGISVLIKNINEITHLYNMGFYGKGSLSKSFPQCVSNPDYLPEVIAEQQFLNRRMWGNKFEVAEKLSSLEDTKLALADESVKRFLSRSKNGCAESWREYKTEIDRERMKSNASGCGPQWTDSGGVEPPVSPLIDLVNGILKSGPLSKPSKPLNCPGEVIVIGDGGGPRLEKAPPMPQEVLQLSFQEAFFLSVLGRLRVYDMDGIVIEMGRLWKLFRSLEEGFLRRYIAFHWYRSRGWIVRSGLKYGSDYLLYEKGPPFCHSSYVVHVISESSVSWSNLVLLQRLSETTKKDLLYCHVLPISHLEDSDLDHPNVISMFNVQEVIYRRWIPSEQRIAKS